MPYLLLGSDSHSKNEFVKSLAAKLSAEVVIFSAEDKLPTQDELSQTDLFAKTKVFLFQGIIPEYLGILPAGEQLKNRVVVSVTSLDKRKKENKELLSNPNIEVTEFVLPHGIELNNWIKNRVSELQGKISKDAVEELAVRLGRDNGKETRIAGKLISAEEVFSLEQVNSELKKLLSFANGIEISKNDVVELVSENGEVDVFDLTNAIADNQKQTALELMNKFLNQQSGSDEKAGVIQLNALLGEQFRSVAALQDFLKNKTSDDEILEQTNWKPGRLFVLKKVAGRFDAKKITDFLNKLEALDQELKTSQIPPRVILDLIVAQLLA